MDVEDNRKRIGLSLERPVRDAYGKFISGVEDYENEFESSRAGLWSLFDPVYNALASSRPPSMRRSLAIETWAKDLILAYRSVNAIKESLLGHLKELQEDDILDEEVINPLDEL